MSTKRVLDVGNCAADHGAICDLLEREFHAEVTRANTAAEAIAALRGGSYSLVLVNRVFDQNGDSGLDLIRSLKADPALAATPVMLITNYPQPAQGAVSLGAAPGFGKRELNASATREKLGAYLG